MEKAKRYGTQVSSTHEDIQRLIPFIHYIPREIFFDILLRLSIKNIILCKCVCKKWHNLISDSYFAKLHLAQAKTCPLVRDRYNSRISRILYLIDPEDHNYDFDSKYSWCHEYAKGNLSLWSSSLGIG